MNCERCSELLIEYIHGGLSPEEREAIAEHLGGCAECAREFEEYAEIRRAVTEESVLPEPSREVMARLSKAARDGVARERRPFWKRLPLSPILIPALTTAVALMVWFYYGQGGGVYMDTMSRDVMARKMKEQDSSMETAGQAAPEMRREYPVEAESSPAMSERGAADEVMPAAPAPPQADLYSLSDETPGASAGTEEDSDVKEEALSETAAKKSAPARPMTQAESYSAAAANDYSGQLLLAL
ncbi:MAG: anti-sigma factor family protein, partial [Thermodesulfobacteriota bacterium]